MLINRIGSSYRYNSVKYTVGAAVVATDKSPYHGLYGRITEIRTGQDMETENDGIDIYCEFAPPIHPDDIKEIEERFSALYGLKKTLLDITIDFVIMAPDMIRIIAGADNDAIKLPIYVLAEEWANDCNCGCSTTPFLNYDDAKCAFNNQLCEEMESGLLRTWEDDDSLVVETSKDCYEAYLAGYIFESHYTLSLKKDHLRGSLCDVQQMYETCMTNISQRDAKDQ